MFDLDEGRPFSGHSVYFQRGERGLFTPEMREWLESNTDSYSWINHGSEFELHFWAYDDVAERFQLTFFVVLE